MLTLTSESDAYGCPTGNINERPKAVFESGELQEVGSEEQVSDGDVGWWLVQLAS